MRKQEASLEILEGPWGGFWGHVGGLWVNLGEILGGSGLILWGSELPGILGLPEHQQ